MQLKIHELYPHLGGLDEYSLEVVRWIHENVPEWMKHARSAIFNESTFLKIELPAPVPMPESGSQQALVIETYGEEIEVEFGGYGMGFSSELSEFLGQSKQTIEEVCIDVKSFIDDLMAERLIVTVRVKRWAMCHAPDDSPQMGLLPEDVPPTYTRSWRGTYNRVYNSDEK